jgi:hypothetical protein
MNRFKSLGSVWLSKRDFGVTSLAKGKFRKVHLQREERLRGLLEMSTQAVQISIAV